MQGPITDMVFPSTYRHRLYDAYLSTNGVWLGKVTRESLATSFPYFRQHFLRYLPSDRSAAILDIGCGYGSLLHFLHSQGYTKAMGVDIGKQQVELAASFGIANVVQGEMLGFLRARSDQFDLIVALDVLEHLGKDELFATLGCRLPGSQARGPLHHANGQRRRPLRGEVPILDLTHELAFTAYSISQALHLAGFSRIEVVPVEPAVHGLKSGIRWVLWQCLRLMLIGYLAVETGVLRGHILSQNLIAISDK